MHLCIKKFISYLNKKGAANLTELLVAGSVTIIITMAVTLSFYSVMNNVERNAHIKSAIAIKESITYMLLQDIVIPINTFKEYSLLELKNLNIIKDLTDASHQNNDSYSLDKSTIRLNNDNSTLFYYIILVSKDDFTYIDEINKDTPIPIRQLTIDQVKIPRADLLDAAGFPDTDGDGVRDNVDAFPNDPNETTDTDGDGVGDNSDNAPNHSNPGQEDSDGDGIGDVIDNNNSSYSYQGGIAEFSVNTTNYEFLYITGNTAKPDAGKWVKIQYTNTLFDYAQSAICYEVMDWSSYWGRTDVFKFQHPFGWAGDFTPSSGQMSSNGTFQVYDNKSNCEN